MIDGLKRVFDITRNGVQTAQEVLAYSKAFTDTINDIMPTVTEQVKKWREGFRYEETDTQTLIDLCQANLAIILNRKNPELLDAINDGKDITTLPNTDAWTPDLAKALLYLRRASRKRKSKLHTNSGNVRRTSAQIEPKTRPPTA